METIDQEKVNDYMVDQSITSSVKEEERSDAPYMETEMDLRAHLLDLKARSINPDMNMSDLVLSTITDAKRITQLLWYLNFQVDCHEAGMPESARFCADKILTNLNFHRSINGAQQQLLITRANIKRVELGKTDDGAFKNVRDKLRR